MVKIHITEMKMRGALDKARHSKRPSLNNLLRYIGEAMPERYKACICTVRDKENDAFGLRFQILENETVVFDWSDLSPGADSLEICRWIIDQVDYLRKQKVNGN